MPRQRRLVEIARMVLAQKEIECDIAISCIDCLLSMPYRFIPSTASLRYFVHDVIDYFCGVCDRCELHYPRAARYIKWWKSLWLNDHSQNPAISSDCVCDLDFRFNHGHSFDIIMLSVDRQMVILEAVGGGLCKLKISRGDLIGLSIKTLKEEWLEKGISGAISGKFLTDCADYRGFRWQCLYSPTIKGSYIVGATCVLTYIPEVQLDILRYSRLPPGMMDN